MLDAQKTETQQRIDALVERIVTEYRPQGMVAQEEEAEREIARLRALLD